MGTHLDVFASENLQSTYEKTKVQISCAVTAQLISAFVFALFIVQCLFFLIPKFQCSNLVENPNCWFIHVKAHLKVHQKN